MMFFWGVSCHVPQIGICDKDKHTCIKYIERSFCIWVETHGAQPMICLQWWGSQESLATSSPSKIPNFHRRGGCCAYLAHDALSGQPVQGVAVFTFHLHLPLSATHAGRGLYFSSVIEAPALQQSAGFHSAWASCSVTANCMQGLHINTAIPQHNSLALKRNNKRKESLFCCIWRSIRGHFVCLWFGGVFFFSHSKKTKQITSNKNIRFSVVWSHRH